jgi:hypothetical protein
MDCELEGGDRTLESAAAFRFLDGDNYYPPGSTMFETMIIVWCMSIRIQKLGDVD